MTCLSFCGNRSHIAFTHADFNLQQKVWPISFIFFCPECGTVIHLNIAAGQYSLKLLNEISVGH